MNVGGRILTQVGGANYPTYQDPAGDTPFPNPIPLNSRGEISNSSGVSSQLFLVSGVTYTFTLYDTHGHVIWTADNITSSPTTNQLSEGGTASSGASLIGWDDENIAYQLTNRINRVASSIAQLRALSHLIYTQAFVTGYYAAHDGGGGAYQYDSSDTTSADNGGTIIVAADGGRWKLQVFNNIVSAEVFGAKGTGLITDDDTAAFQSAATWLGSIGGGTLTYGGKHYIATSISLPRNVSLIGPEGFSNPGNPAFAYRTGTWAALQAAPKIMLASAATINTLGTQVLRGCLITLFGLKLDGTDSPSSYAGTAVLATTTDGVTLDSCTILGFTQAFYSNGSAAILCQYTYVDCTNGFLFSQGFDIIRCLNCHCYNFLQSDVATNPADTQRAGYAYRFTGQTGGGVNGPSCVGCFAYGYQYGFFSDAAGSYTFIDCWADGPTNSSTNEPLWSDSIGFCFNSTEDANAEFQMMGCRASAQATGVYVGPGMYGVSIVDGLTSWGCMIAVRIGSPGVNISNAAIRGYFSDGIQYVDANSANGCSVTDTRFYARQAITPSPVDLDFGGGEPVMKNVGYVGGDLSVYNIGVFTLTWASGSTIDAPAERDTVVLDSTGNVGDLTTKFDGRQVTLVFAVGTTTPYTGPFGPTSFYDANPGGNFRLNGAFLATPGSTIRVRFDGTASVWREMYRTLV
jgi:hypothetical protein